MPEFEFNGGFASVAVSTRVRLARNFKGYTYKNITSEKQKEIADKIWNVFKSTPAIADKFELSEVVAGSNSAMALVAKHQISPELAQSGGYIIRSKNGGVSIMVGEEDHMRLQVMGSGLCPKECIEEAGRLSALIEAQMPMDYDENLGYLTACPSNLGTGLRASVMMHLPMLESTGGINELIRLCSRQGFTVRGAYGEGSEATGSFYQLSNQVTLGISEDSIIDKLISICTDVIEKEKQGQIQTAQNLSWSDRICRSVGTLQTARKVTSSEAISCLSLVLIGMTAGFINGVTAGEIWSLEQDISPYAISGDANERDEKRAQIIRERTKSVKITI